MANVGRIRLDEFSGPLLWEVVNDAITEAVRRRGATKAAEKPHDEIDDDIRELKRIKAEIERTWDERGWDEDA